MSIVNCTFNRPSYLLPSYCTKSATYNKSTVVTNTVFISLINLLCSCKPNYCKPNHYSIYIGQFKNPHFFPEIQTTPFIRYQSTEMISGGRINTTKTSKIRKAYVIQR